MKLKRIVSIFIDYFIIVSIGIFSFLIIAKIFNITDSIFYDVLELIWMTCLFCIKDLPFKEGSLGKKICRLNLLKTNDEKSSNLLKMLRNLTILIWPIELILILLFDKRLGDIIFKTKVIEKDI